MLLHHRYKILRDLAEGSFGKTFLAEDIQMPTRQRCVIKQLKPINDDRPEVVQLIQERFAREAAVIEAVGQGHRQIPDLLAYFQVEERFYLVQEWVEGTPLSELVTAPWPEEKVRSLLISALDALAHVHAQNVIHRDLKPDNIILRQADQLPCLIDFGAVKELMNTVVVPSESQASSVVIGTLGFMAPEQAVGRPVFSSDLYSLGMTAIYLLTARSPLAIPTDSMNGRLLWNQFAQNVSPRLAGILTRAIHPYPPTRFASATDMMAVLTEEPEQNRQNAVPVDPPSSPTLVPSIAATEVSLPEKSRPKRARSATVLGSSATQIGSSTTQLGSSATQITAKTPSAPTNKYYAAPQPATAATAAANSPQRTAIASPSASSAPIASAANPYYSLGSTKHREKENTAFFLKAGGAVVVALAVCAVSLFGFNALSSGSANAEIDASSPEKLIRTISQLEETVDARSDNTEAQVKLIEAYIYRGEYTAAIAFADALIQSQSASSETGSDITAETIVEALYWKGSAQVTQGDYQSAIATLTQVVEQDGDNALAFNLLGRAYQEIGQYDNALARFQAAATADPDYSVAYMNQASLKETQGDYEATEALLEEALAVLDDNERISFHRVRANFYTELGDSDLAEADWETVVALSPQNAVDYVSTGFSQGMLGNAEAAMDSFEQALSINPNSTDAYITRSLIHFQQGDIDLATADVDSTLSINPKSVAAYQIKSNLEAARPEPDLEVAVEAATNALDINPNHPALLKDRCGGYFLLKQLEKAIADCTRSVEINPIRSEPYNVRGQAYFAQQNHTRAEEDFTRVIELNDAAGKPQTALVYSARGLSRAELDNNAGAQADLTEAIALDDDNPDYYKIRGMLRFINEEQETAVADLLKSEELYEAQGKEDEDLNEILSLLSQLGLL